MPPIIIEDDHTFDKAWDTMEEVLDGRLVDRYGGQLNEHFGRPITRFEACVLGMVEAYAQRGLEISPHCIAILIKDEIRKVEWEREHPKNSRNN